MSADHLTEDFAAYFHEDCAAVFWRSGELLIRIDGSLMRQLQSVTDSWAAWRIRAGEHPAPGPEHLRPPRHAEV